MALNINLGKPYEEFIETMIKKGYAGSQVEVIRQALSLYRKQMEGEAKEHAAKARESEPIKAGKPMPLKGIKEKFGLE